MSLCHRQRSASAVNSAIAPYDSLNTQPLTKLPNPRSVGECRSAIVICHLYSVGEHLSGRVQASSHEPPHIHVTKAARETQLFCSLLTANSPSTQRRDAARRNTFISVVFHQFLRTATNASRKRSSNTAVLAVNVLPSHYSTAVSLECLFHITWDISFATLLG